MATNVCRAKGNYGWPFKASHSVTQGRPLLAKLFNIIVNVVVCKWMRLMHKMLDYTEGDLAKFIESIFAVFYFNNWYIALQRGVPTGGSQHSC